jgi:outer membrane biosynthesis protein TonB
MNAKEALKLWENLGTTLKRIEKHNAHQLDVDAAQHQIRELYTSLLELDTMSSDMNAPTKTTPKAADEKPVTEKPAPPPESEPPAKEVESENPKPAPTDESENKPAQEEVTGELHSDMFTDRQEEKSDNNQEKTTTEKKKPAPTETNKENPSAGNTRQDDLFGNATEANTSGEKSQALGEKLGANKKAVNEKIGGNNQPKDLASKLKSKPVTDIKAAIGLGDRFLFIKNLFNGNADEFNRCIDELNSKTSLDEAKQCLADYNLDLDDKTVQYFLSIIERKFPQND